MERVLRILGKKRGTMLKTFLTEFIETEKLPKASKINQHRDKK